MNSTKFLTKSLFKKLKTLLDENSYWDDYLNSFESWNEFPHGIHLAIFVEPYLTYVLDGKKTVESRFSINRSPPYKKVKSGDIVFVKTFWRSNCRNMSSDKCMVLMNLTQNLGR